MKIEIQNDSLAIAANDRIELRHRARLWLRRVKQIIGSLCVKITEACASAAADDRFCTIEAHLANGLLFSAEARGHDTVVAFDRALRRLARTISSHLKRESFRLHSA